MIKLGERQKLSIVKKVNFGVYLADVPKEEEGGFADDTVAGSAKEPEERVLLPGKEVPENAEIGDELDVFIYRDSEDRLIATTRQTELSVGKTAVLKVKEVGKIGAFLGWSLEKDLLLPFKEQTCNLSPGTECLVALYIDKSGRLCTTMKVYPYLRTDSSCKKDDRVEGRVYEIIDKFGIFVAVDDRYSAMIPKKEPAAGIRVGDKVSARVTEVLEDGKLSLSLREKAYLQMEKDAALVMKMLEENGGRLPFNDKADAELIRGKTGMSKNEFKRAVGKLYKQRLIVIEPEGIKKV